MRRPVDPDEWPLVSVKEFVGWILLAILIVVFVWIASVFYLIALTPE